jgi:hypothetical protein
MLRMILSTHAEGRGSERLNSTTSPDFDTAPPTRGVFRLLVENSKL